MQIDYAKTAKKIDIKKLKENIWTSLNGNMVGAFAHRSACVQAYMRGRGGPDRVLQRSSNQC